jgi:preprotein translocase subunit SecF
MLLNGSGFMEFIKPGININFVGRRKVAYVFSGLMVIASVFLLILRGGPNLGVDFTGGVLIQVRLEQKKPISDMKTGLESVGLADSIIQEFGEEQASEYLIRLRQTDIELSGLSDRVKEALQTQLGSEVEIRRVEAVGPKVGHDLTQKALFAIFYAILFMAIYISGRFELKWLMSIVMAVSLVLAVYLASSFGAGVGWLILVALIVTLGLCWFLKLKYALGAIVALVHDVAITVGIFALTDREISLSIIAALLTIVGYSLNDTIIVFDRIRENLRRFRRRPLDEVLNTSINQTLSRTVLTASTTLVVVVALFILGGGVIHDFAFAMMIGIIVGTYSSIYVASPILLLWEGNAAKGVKENKGAQ